jgi:poly(3-hydroxybutyrate) depolymerase
MSVNISGPFGRASIEHKRSIRATGCLGTCLAAWAIGCSGSSTPASPGSDIGQGGSTAVATGGTVSGPSTGGVSQTATGGTPASGGAPATGGRQAVATGGSPVQAGGSPPTGGSPQTGGRSSIPPTGGATAIAAGGTTAVATGGTQTTTSGGTSVMPTGGRTSAAGNTSTGGSSAGAGGGTAPGGATPSKGCGTQGMQTLLTGATAVSGGLSTSHLLKITSGGASRDYIIDIPANYDPTQPYRLIFSWHQAYGSANGNAVGQYPAFNGPNFDAQHYAYFGLQREATAANQPAIFVAPAGIGNFPWDYARDVVLFDDLLALVTRNLCIDESRVFTTGFSFGAMMSYALSIGRASKLRAAVTMAAANYNFTQPTNAKTPIAYFGITGMSDGTCPWIRNNTSTTEGGKYCVLQHASDNGCTIPGTLTTTTVGSKKYLCYDFEGCKAGYPVKVCTFDGAHTPSAVDDGTNTGDDGLKAFVPPLAWKFMAQF